MHLQLPEPLKMRVDKVLESQEDAAADISDANARKRLIHRFGIETDKEAAPSLGFAVKRYASGRKIG